MTRLGSGLPLAVCSRLVPAFSPPAVRLAALVLACAAVVAPGRAQAYERARVEGAPERAVFWPVRTLEVRLTPELGGLAEADVAAAATRSLAAWTRAGGCTDVTLGLGAIAAASGTNLDGGRFDGENRVVFRRSWPGAIGPETVALTTYAYRPSTGELLDADIDLNAASSTFVATVPAPPAGLIDVENTLSHELGHLLGFAHVSDPEATMYGGSADAETLKRDLAPDDVRAVCETYPVGAPTPPAPPLLAPGSGGCTARGSSRGSGAPAIAILVALSARAVRRSPRRARPVETASVAR